MYKISEYENDNRSAIIFKDDKGLVVELFEEGEMLKSKILANKTEQYAEDLCENWVMHWGEFK